MTTEWNRDVQIINTLCSSTYSFTTLLSELQTNYPSTGWTSSQLTNDLNRGLKRGVYTNFGTNIWRINQNMTAVNPQNAKYLQVCQNISSNGLESTTVYELVDDANDGTESFNSIDAVTGTIDALTCITISGTLTTAAQPNITSLGTLTGLTTSTLKVTSGASAGYILVSDASGNATWTDRNITFATNSNVVIGEGTVFPNLDPSTNANNTVIGSDSWGNITTAATKSVFIGTQCTTTQSGDENVLIGDSITAGGDNGDQNVLVGARSNLFASSTRAVGIGCVAGGRSSSVCVGYSTDCGESSVCIGASASGLGASTNNVIIGKDAEDKGSGNNICIGTSSSIPGALSTNTTLVGYNAIAGSDNQIVLGAGADGSTFGGSASSLILPTAFNKNVVGKAIDADQYIEVWFNGVQRYIPLYA